MVLTFLRHGKVWSKAWSFRFLIDPSSLCDTSCHVWNTSWYDETLPDHLRCACYVRNPYKVEALPDCLRLFLTFLRLFLTFLRLFMTCLRPIFIYLRLFLTSLRLLDILWPFPAIGDCCSQFETLTDQFETLPNDFESVPYLFEMICDSWDIVSLMWPFLTCLRLFLTDLRHFLMYDSLPNLLACLGPLETYFTLCLTCLSWLLC